MTSLLHVEGLQVGYGRGRNHKTVIEDVSFDLAAGETVALVGESGSGKTTIGRAILGLVPIARGVVELDGRDLRRLGRSDRRRVAADLQVIFQDPYGSLNPSLTIGDTLSEPLRVQGGKSAKESRAQVEELLVSVGMPPGSSSRYPAQFSGGQRQRIAIARAVAVNPRLIVCDEPTSALDVSTQARVLTLLREMQVQRQVGYLFITHDLAVVREFADRVVVLRHGRIVETGPARDVCDSPQHPYTRRLVAAAPVPDPVLQRSRRSALAAVQDATDAGPAPEDPAPRDLDVAFYEGLDPRKELE
jgi:ABC-type glutathione transport system ATPase component